MPNAIERDVYVLRNTLKNPISYVRGTDLLPIIFHFRDFTIPSGATATAFTAKPDGNAVYGSATISENDVTVDVQQQMFIVLGLSMLQVEIKSGEETLATFAQPVMVEPNLKAGDFPPSTTDIEFLDEAIEQAQEAVKDAQQAIADANTAISGANTAAESANSAAQNANNAAKELQDKVGAGDFTASVQVGTTTTLEPGQDATVSNSGTNKDAVLNFGIPKGDPGTAASIQVGTTQTAQPEENAEVTNSGTTTAAVLDFKIPRGEDGMTDLTAEYKDASEYTCQPTVNAPVVLKEISGKTEQGADPSPDNPQVIKGVGGMGYFDGEWVQGNISSTGAVGTETTGITSANAIPCKQNDNIAVTYEDSIDVIAVAFYNASGAYISTSTSGNSVDTFTATAPANAASFKVNLRVASGSTITPNGAKYCTVTINGEYQTGVEVLGKNLLANDFFSNILKTGQYQIKFSPIDVSNSRYGTIITYLNSGTYILSCKDGYYFSVNRAQKDGKNAIAINSQCFPYTFTVEKSGLVAFSVERDTSDKDKTDINIGNNKPSYFGFMIRKSELTDSYEPYRHTSIQFPLTSPLYEGDKICYVKPGESYVDAEGETVVADRILYGCYRENASVVFDGSSDEGWILNTETSDFGQFTIIGMSGSLSADGTLNASTGGISSNFGVSNQIGAGNEKSGAWIYNSTTVALVLPKDLVEYNVSALKTWLSTNPLTVVYRLAQPYFEPFADQAPFYTLRTDDALTYIYSNDPIEPNVTVEVAKNSTGGYLLESYAQAQKNALAEADNASRLASVEQQLLTLNTTVSTMGGAVSDLQTNTYALKGGTAIPASADMNSYVTPGNYYCHGDSIAQTLTNSPLQKAFTLKIDYGNGTKYPRQTYKDCVTGKIAMRYYNSDTDKWGSYVYLIPTTQS